MAILPGKAQIRKGSGHINATKWPYRTRSQAVPRHPRLGRPGQHYRRPALAPLADPSGNFRHGRGDEVREINVGADPDNGQIYIAAVAMSNRYWRNQAANGSWQLESAALFGNCYTTSLAILAIIPT